FAPSFPSSFAWFDQIATMRSADQVAEHRLLLDGRSAGQAAYLAFCSRTIPTAARCVTSVCGPRA
ncbi:hypothetical protein, partial [Nocardia farcinica]